MAASKDKAILFARATAKGQHHLWPVAVFNSVPDARNYAAFLKMAYGVKDQEVIKALDPTAIRDEGGDAVESTKWSVKVVPYAPAPVATADDVPEEVSPAS